MLQKGNRVTATGHYESNLVKGKNGTVIGFSCFRNEVLVEFDEDVSGHDGFRFEIDDVIGKDGHCWYMPEDLLSLITEPTHAL